jgi:hypothetical protein
VGEKGSGSLWENLDEDFTSPRLWRSMRRKPASPFATSQLDLYRTGLPILDRPTFWEIRTYHFPYVNGRYPL